MKNLVALLSVLIAVALLSFTVTYIVAIAICWIFSIPITIYDFFVIWLILISIICTYGKD